MNKQLVEVRAFSGVTAVYSRTGNSTNWHRPMSGVVIQVSVPLSAYSQRYVTVDSIWLSGQLPRDVWSLRIIQID